MLNKIDVIKEELNKYQIAFTGFNEDLEKYKLIEDEEKINDTNKMIKYTADKIVHYTYMLHKENHENDDLKALNKSINGLNKILNKILAKF